MRRQSDYKPPRSLSHWLIGRPLMTADAPHQTIVHTQRRSTRAVAEAIRALQGYQTVGRRLPGAHAAQGVLDLVAGLPPRAEILAQVEANRKRYGIE